MYAGFSFILGTYAAVQAGYNFYFSKRKIKNSPEWTYQNRVMCKKTYRGQLVSAVVMFILGIIFSIIGK